MQFKPGIFALLSVLLIMSPAHAAVVLEHQTRGVGSSRGEQFNPLFIIENSLPFTSEFNGSVSSPGGVAQQMSVVDVLPDSGILTGASGSGSIVDAGTNTRAHSQFLVLFNVTDNPASVLLDIDTIGTAPGVAGFALSRLDPFELLFNHPNGTFSGSFDEELDVGRYRFEISAFGPGMNAGRQSWEFDLAFPLHWLNPVDGTFGDGGKWSSGAPPSGAVNALIDRPGTYTVTLAGNAAHRRLDVTGDGANVTLDVDGHRYQLDELRLGDPSGNFSFTLADSSGIVAVPPGEWGPWPAPGTGEVVVTSLKADGPGRTDITATVATQFGLIEDGHIVNVKGDGEWQVDQLTVGRERAATLMISGGGKVGSRSASIGQQVRGLLNSPGKVIVSAGAGQVSKFDATTMVVGVDGKGELEIKNGGTVTAEEFAIGDNSNGVGVVTVDGITARLQSLGTVIVGHKGKGTLDVKNDARVDSGNMSVGGLVGSEGVVNVSHNGFIATQQLFVQSVGTLNVLDDGLVSAKRATIHPGGMVTVADNGAMIVDNELIVNGDLSVNTTGAAFVGHHVGVTPNNLTLGPGGTLRGNGTIRANLNLAGGDGIFTGSRFAPANSTGTMTIEGDVEQEAGSALEIEIGGTAAGAFDVVKVTGNVALGGDVFLKFTDGFSPQQGQQFQFLDITGTLSGAFAKVQLRNLAPGFQFELQPGGGGMTMVALSDGEFMLPESSAWNVDASGNWSSVANWTAGDLNHAGVTAVLGNKITAARSVTVDAPVTVGRINFDNANAYTIAGEDTLTLDAASGTGQIHVVNGGHTISAPVALADNTVVTVSSALSTLTITGALNTGGASLTKEGAGALIVNNVRAAALTASAGAVVIAANGGDSGTSVVDTLSVTGTGRFDLNNNDLVVHATAATKDAVHNAIQDDIASAQNGVDGSFITNWDGPGITSTSARTSNVATGFDLVGLGVIRNSDRDIITGLPGSSFISFGGQTVTPDDVLVKYTYIGDGNLDGLVSFDDYVGMDNAFFGLIANLGWATGDINFDGLINFDDYSVVDQAFFFQGAPLASAPAAATVPEPETILIAGLAALCTLTAMRIRQARPASPSTSGTC